MTTNESAARDDRTRQRILHVLRNDRMLHRHAASIRVDVADSRVVLTGALPASTLVDQLVPAIRRAGVLSQVTNQVRIGRQAA